MPNPPEVFAASGTTTALTSAAVEVPRRRKPVMQFTVESIGATPSITYYMQGSMDGATWVNALWHSHNDAFYTTSSRTRTTAGADMNFIALEYRYLRLITHAVTNITYRAEVFFV